MWYGAPSLRLPWGWAEFKARLPSKVLASKCNFLYTTSMSPYIFKVLQYAHHICVKHVIFYVCIPLSRCKINSQEEQDLKYRGDKTLSAAAD